MQAGEERPAGGQIEILRSDRFLHALAPFGAEGAQMGEQLLEVGEVGAHGVGRGSPLGAEVLGENRDEIAHVKAMLSGGGAQGEFSGGFRNNRR